MSDLLEDACEALGVAVSRPLQDGGQKRVFVVQGANGDESVLKLIDLAAARDPAALERAHREVDLLRRINHQNVVQVTSELVQLGTPVQAVAWLEELLDGSDLRHSVGSPWASEKILQLGIGVSSGLGALHAQRVIHRDLSSGNIRCLADGTFKVMDPGFAKHTLRSGLTVGGQPGTPGFMSPEHIQAYSGAPTPASDVFGCAGLMYLAAAGQVAVPYKGDDTDYMRRLRAATHIPLKIVRTDLPAPLVDVVERGLHPQPARRYRNGSAMADALKDVL